jgi:hypothetical protein
MLLKEKGRVISAKRAQPCECRQQLAFSPLRSHRQRSRGLFARKARNSNIESTEGGRGGVVWRNH